MPISLGVVANIYNEANALPGWLECVTQWADDVRVYHAGPGGRYSNDGTMEILEKWKIPVAKGTIDDGFGIARTATVRFSPCEWVMLLDADERFYMAAPELMIEGFDTPPEEVDRILRGYDAQARSGTGDGQWQSWEDVSKLGAGLKVTMGNTYNQVAWLKDFLQYGALDAVTTIRRHWHDFTWKRPTQNWHVRPDYQARIVRNVDSIHWDANTRMHEQLLGASNRYQPNQTHGPFYDHYHMHFKAMEAAQRAHDIRIYDAIHERREVPHS